MAMNIDVNPDEKNYRKVESEMNPIIVVITYALIYWVFRLFRCEGKLYFYIFPRPISQTFGIFGIIYKLNA